ncbi:MAG: MOSC domain-containing protein [Anaerolineales bacterium]
MKLISINIGKKRTLPKKDSVEVTGIFKIPVHDSVQITNLGFVDDFIGSKKHHGGPDQAVYLYGGADYAWWSAELGQELAPGTFGENLTISELRSAEFNIGDIISMGGVRLQVTAPRIPCGTFARRMEDSQWVKKFRHAERPGLYCRVIQEGILQAGYDVSIERYTGETISILDNYRGYYEKDKSEEFIRRQLKAPIAIRARVALEKELESLLK